MPVCQTAAIQSTDAASEFESLGAVTIIVYREDVAKVAGTCEDRHTKALYVSDRLRTLEDAVALKRFNPFRYVAFSPGLVWAARAAGAKVGGMGRNVLQGHGTYVVDRTGTVVYAHHARTAADTAPIDDVIAAVRSAASTAGA